MSVLLCVHPPLPHNDQLLKPPLCDYRAPLLRQSIRETISCSYIYRVATSPCYCVFLPHCHITVTCWHLSCVITPPRYHGRNNQLYKITCGVPFCVMYSGYKASRQTILCSLHILLHKTLRLISDSKLLRPTIKNATTNRLPKRCGRAAAKYTQAWYRYHCGAWPSDIPVCQWLWNLWGDL